jgi:hypothetical protein
MREHLYKKLENKGVEAERCEHCSIIKVNLGMVNGEKNIIYTSDEHLDLISIFYSRPQQSLLNEGNISCENFEKKINEKNIRYIIE